MDAGKKEVMNPFQFNKSGGRAAGSDGVVDQAALPGLNSTVT
jgi:hypothetical protein